MSDYAWVSINKPDDFDQLESLLDREFAPKAVIAKLKAGLSLRVAAVLIEREYIDKDYRSTFYKHYAKKGRPYRDDCVRLHFFDAGVSYDDAQTDLRSMAGSLEGQYFGFIVLRPTLESTIGRSILSPDIRNGAQGKAIQGEHGVHLLGHKLRVWGFPSMAQHGDISVCAHVCCWSILRHYSERYPQTSEWLLQDISKLASTFDPGDLTPGLGLNVLHAKYVLQAAGTYPLVVSGEDDLFHEQFLAYLESGFPLFVSVKQQHAVVAAGYSWASPANKLEKDRSHAWEQVGSILVIDDNALPYVSVNRDAVSGALPASGRPEYDANDFDSFIVALPEKIFYSAVAVEEYSKDTLYDVLKLLLPMPPKSGLVRRYFIATISGLRRYARENASALGAELVNMIMRLRTSQFVWVVEYASLDQWSNSRIAARAILDASASINDRVPVWFAHGDRLGILFDRDNPELDYSILDLKRPTDAPLSRMEVNLRPVRPWKPGRAVGSGSH